MEKRERGAGIDYPNFSSTPIIPGMGKATNFKYFTHVDSPSEQKPIKNFQKSSRGRTQGLPKIFRARIHRVRCAVIFAVAQLSCCHTSYARTRFFNGHSLDYQPLLNFPSKLLHPLGTEADLDMFDVFKQRPQQERAPLAPYNVGQQHNII